MTTRSRGPVLRLLARLAPGLVDSIEAESRSWTALCPHCDTRSSVWSMGGIRWKAAGRPLVRLRCPDCGRRFPGRLERTGGSDREPA